MSVPNLILEEEHLQQVRQILASLIPYAEVWAFGSRVSSIDQPSQPRRFSDLDLVIMGEEPMPLEVLAGLHYAFSESDLPIRVDIVDWASTAESFRKIIEYNYAILQHPGNPTRQ